MAASIQQPGPRHPIGSPTTRAATAARVSSTFLDVDAVAVEPAAVGIDLGSGYTRIWATGWPTLGVPTIRDSLTNPSGLVRRGRITDPPGVGTC